MAYAIIEGEVVRTFYNGQGASVKETFQKRDGTEGAAYFTVFGTEELGVSEGDRATFKGNLSVTLDTYEKDGEDRYSAKATLNNTKVSDLVSGDAGATASSAPAGQVGF